MSYDPFIYTVEAFLGGEVRDYKSAKGRFSTDGEYFYSYDMPIGWRRADGIVEVLHDGRAPTMTTARHVVTLTTEVGVRRKVEVVYDLDAPVCSKCGARHGDDYYPTYARHDSAAFPAGYSRHERKHFTSPEEVCESLLKAAAAEKAAIRLTKVIEERGLTAGTSVRYHAAVRDAKLPYERGYALHPQWGDMVISTHALWVKPVVLRVLDLDIPHEIKRAFLKRMGNDVEFYEAIEALAAAPGALSAFITNYGSEINFTP